MSLSRLRRGEWVVLGSAIALLVLLFAVKWYGVRGQQRSVSGWHALTHVRWYVLVAVAAALALAFAQATRRSPALPVTMSVVVTTLGLLLVAALVYRVLLDEPGPQKVGAYLGLAAGVGIFLGACFSMRTEGIPDRDAPPEIETIDLSGHT